MHAHEALEKLPLLHFAEPRECGRHLIAHRERRVVGGAMDWTDTEHCRRRHADDARAPRGGSNAAEEEQKQRADDSDADGQAHSSFCSTDGRTSILAAGPCIILTATRVGRTPWLRDSASGQHKSCWRTTHCALQISTCPVKGQLIGC